MAQLTAAELNNLPDSDFAYIEPGGTLDAEGKTVPRSLRHYAIHDEAHVRDALARAAAAKNAGGHTAEIAGHAMPKIEAAAKRMGIGEPAMRSEMPLSDGSFLVRTLQPTITYEDGESVRSVDLRAEGESSSGLGYLTGRFAVFDTWTEVRSAVEGHFMERTGDTAFRKTLSDGRPPILFNHGWNPQIGTSPIAPTEEIGTDQRGGYYGGPLLAGVPELVVSGLRANLYGSSYRFRAVKPEVIVRPKPSGYNPEGIPEVTIREAAVREIGPGIFPIYAGTTAALRSETDDYLLSRFGDPEQLRAFISAQQGPLALGFDGAAGSHSDEASRSAPVDAPPTHPKRFRSRDEWLAYLKEQSRT